MLFGTEILTTAQMRAIESAATASGQVTGAQLMERAGAAAAQVIMQEQPRPGHAMILCGPGNNGGDGFVVARHLHHMGWRIRLGLWGDPLRLPGDARLMHDEWARLGEVAPLSQRMMHETRPGPDVIVDAIFGTGLSRPPEGELAAILEDLGDLVRFWQGPRPTVFSLDAPSGLNMDSGRTFVPSMPDTGAAMVPLSNVTIAFHSLKPGHLLDDGPHYCGRTIVVDIGLPHGGSDIYRVDKPCESWLQKSEHHKYRHGHALILAGAAPMAGAARLAARAALRVGAGVVTLCPPSEAVMAAAGLDAVMLRAVDTGADLSNTLRDRRINALCLGPGLGRERAAWLLPAALDGDRACVLDADALTAFRDDPARLFAQTHARTVMTPHPGEFHHLFPDLAERLQDDVNFSKVDAARAASARAGCIFLLKGPDTVIAAADGKVAIHRADDVPWLATAGSGDVLAGLITGLLARGLQPLNAAATGAWLHAAAARRFGPGLIADDLPDQIPGVFRDLGL